jgi:mannose-6-phosphate isomerase-like protein (cupin superfamily)
MKSPLDKTETEATSGWRGTEALIARRDLFGCVAALMLGQSELVAAPGTRRLRGAAQPGAGATVLVKPEEGDRGEIGGNRVQFKITRQHTAGALATVEGKLAPGRMGAPPHRHAAIDEVARVLEGELTILVEDEVVQVPAGGWHLRPRGKVHSFWNAGSSTVHFIEMYLPGSHEAYMRDLAALLASNQQPPNAALDALAKRHDIEFFWDRLPPILERFRVRL